MKRLMILMMCIALLLSGMSYPAAQAEDNILLPASVLQADGTDRWGYINMQGTQVIQPDYISAGEFNDKGIAIVAKGENTYDYCSVYFIDKSGKIVSGPYMASIPTFSDGLALLNGKNGTNWVVNSSGKLLFTSTDLLYPYSDKQIAFSKKTADDGSFLYGLKDLTGKVVVPAKYSRIEEYQNETGAGSKLIPYYDQTTYKYGYKKPDGSKATAAMFDSAGDFIDGLAVVSVEIEEYVYRSALINDKFEYVMKPEYTGITSLGSGLYAVSKGGDYGISDYYMPKAVFNNMGQQLSDYKYYSISAYDGDYASASDNTTSFFIDKKGKVVPELPILKGIGTMSLVHGIVKAELDSGLQYVEKNGRSIWQKDETISLDKGLQVKTSKYRRDFLTYVEYPELQGLSSKTVQDGINKKLKDIFVAGYDSPSTPGTAADEEEYAASNEVSFTVQKNQNLLIVEEIGYYYPLGAAHGQPSRYYHYIDLQTGTFYAMKDLFKAGSKYTEKLTSLVQQKKKLDDRIYNVLADGNYINGTPEVADSQCYLLGKDSITFIYQPYEIAAYAAGFPEISIPYSQMADILNTNGNFWKSFAKTTGTKKIGLYNSEYWESDIDAAAVSALTALTGSYESKIIDAVNTNSFAKVEPFLLKGSSLYTAQQKLVANLYKKKTKEKLVSYEISGIGYDNEKKIYKIFVSEVIAIQYAGKAYVNKKYDWCYTAKLDASKTYKLTDIQSW